MSWILYYFGLLHGLIVLLLVFKTKTYYEDGNRQNGQLKGGTILFQTTVPLWTLLL